MNILIFLAGFLLGVAITLAIILAYAVIKVLKDLSEADVWDGGNKHNDWQRIDRKRAGTSP